MTQTPVITRSTDKVRQTAHKMSHPRLVIMAFALASSFAVASPADDRKSIRAIIDAIEYGWENADGTPFREHFLDFDGARYIETGGQNVGLTDLVEHHVEPEGDFLDHLDLTFSNVEIHLEQGFAWALADVEVVATVKRDGRHIHNRGYETFLFRWVGGDWKVVHTHSSTRPVKTADAGSGG